ncbi:MAG TPA: hypothetical protein VFW09_21045 [Solirubrobacteraceae bacterium]|nr:hypothetical protein [Solirubrobacteraceae bacterium]
MSVMTSPSTNHADPAARRALAAQPFTPVVISESSARMLAVLGMAAIAVIHILDAAGTYSDSRYIFWLYMAIVAGAVPISLLLLHWRSPLAWTGVAALAAGPLLGYVLTRAVGLPGDSADIGNWLDTLGLASLFVESGVLGLAATRLVLAWRLDPTAASR